MQIRAITVNAAGTIAAERGIQGTGPLDTNQVQTENSNRFGPECKVTISKEGKDLSRRQTAQAEKDAQSTQGVREEKKLLRQQEQAELAKEIRDGYRESLNEIEKQITDLNTSYAKFDRNKVLYDAGVMEKTEEEQGKLKEAMQSQKRFQTEEGQRRAREAQQMAMQAAQYKDEIDENNRDLLTLLKTMEETEKAEDERKNGKSAGDSKGSGTSAAGNSASDVIQNSAAQFMTSSVKREMGVEGLLSAIEESGNWFLDTANSITQDVLRESANIRAALDDDSFTDETIAEMMQGFQEGMELNLENVRDFRSFGLKVLGDVRETKIQHLADDPLKGMQKTKESIQQSAVDAALGEARQSSLDKASQDLADEVEKLIDQRNDVDRIPQEKEEDEDEEEQAKMPEEAEEQAQVTAFNSTQSEKELSL